MRVEKYFAGPKKGYPRLPRKLAAVAQLSRPYTVFAAWIAGFILGLYYSGFVKGMLLGLVFASIQAFGQVVNQIADVEIDRINKPYRPLPSGRISEDEAWAIAAIYYVLGAWFSWFLGPRALILYTVGIWFGLFYSVEPIRAKKRAWLALLWQAFSRGFYPPLVAYLVIEPDTRLVYLSVLAFAWVIALQPSKDFGDVEGDRMYGITTLPILYGREGALRIMRVATIAYTLLSIAMWLLAGFKPWYVLAGMLGLWALNKVDEETVTENNVAWTIYYAGLGLHYLLFVIPAP